MTHEPRLSDFNDQVYCTDCDIDGSLSSYEHVSSSHEAKHKRQRRVSSRRVTVPNSRFV